MEKNGRPGGNGLAPSILQDDYFTIHRFSGIQELDIRWVQWVYLNLSLRMWESLVSFPNNTMARGAPRRLAPGRYPGYKLSEADDTRYVHRVRLVESFCPSSGLYF